jgi:succinoglycan biosynthesis protein ExoM
MPISRGNEGMNLLAPESINMGAKDSVPHPTQMISVCVCTYKRPKQLNQLLQRLAQQDTMDLFQFSIVVVDNDTHQSAKEVVESCRNSLSIPIAYGTEPRQNIALARNASVRMATGRLVAFIDDDEEPSYEWLRKLYETFIKYEVDGVIGAVIPRFDKSAPAWAIKGELFRRPAFKTGTIVHWTATATNNALVKRDVLLELSGPFQIQFGAGGEDRDLFRRAILLGRTFVWSAEAVCYEPIPKERTHINFQLRRALLRGKMALSGPGGNWVGIVKSAVAVPLYAIALPFCLARGPHLFVTYLVKSFDHLGKLLAAFGINLVGDKYIL